MWKLMITMLGPLPFILQLSIKDLNIESESSVLIWWGNGSEN